MYLAKTYGEIRPGAVDLVSLLAVHSERTKEGRILAVNGSGPDSDRPTVRGYIGAQRLYFEAVGPWERATFVVVNSDVTSVP